MRNDFYERAFISSTLHQSKKLEANLSSKEISNKIKFKRIYDVIIAFFAVLLICSWLFPIIAIMIKLTSNGSIIFKQLRHGKDNVPFYCYKFRTMVWNKEADTVQAKKNDQRITKFGAYLRKSSLDELPQVFNVLRGEMSIVGPRPHAIPMNEVFAKEIPGYLNRHAVKPGITGLAQAKGYRGEIMDFQDLYFRHRLDLFYIRRWHMLFDLKIIFLTVSSLIFKNNKAY